jgi:hypothetical protein
MDGAGTTGHQFFWALGHVTGWPTHGLPWAHQMRQGQNARPDVTGTAAMTILLALRTHMAFFVDNLYSYLQVRARSHCRKARGQGMDESGCLMNPPLAPRRTLLGLSLRAYWRRFATPAALKPS